MPATAAQAKRLAELSQEATDLAAKLEANRKQQDALRFVIDYAGELLPAAILAKEKAAGIVNVPP